MPRAEYNGLRFLQAHGVLQLQAKVPSSLLVRCGQGVVSLSAARRQKWAGYSLGRDYRCQLSTAWRDPLFGFECSCMDFQVIHFLEGLL